MITEGTVEQRVRIQAQPATAWAFWSSTDRLPMAIEVAL